MQEAFKFRPGTLTLVPVPAAYSRAEPRTCFGLPRHPPMPRDARHDILPAMTITAAFSRRFPARLFALTVFFQ